MGDWRTIYKYPLPQPVMDLDLPVGAKVVRVGTQNFLPTLWIEHAMEPEQTEKRTFIGHGTGHPIPPGEVYVGTAHNVEDEGLVFHIYERVK